MIIAQVVAIPVLHSIPTTLHIEHMLLVT